MSEWTDPMGDIARFAVHARERHEALMKEPHYAIVEDRLIEMTKAELESVTAVELPPNSISFSTRDEGPE